MLARLSLGYFFASPSGSLLGAASGGASFPGGLTVSMRSSARRCSKTASIREAVAFVETFRGDVERARRAVVEQAHRAAEDGRVLWRADVFGWAWPRPAASAELVYAAAVGTGPYNIRHLGGLTALDRKTGKMVWRWPMPEWPGSLTYGFAAPPVVEGQTLVIGGLYAFPVS